METRQQEQKEKPQGLQEASTDSVTATAPQATLVSCPRHSPSWPHFPYSPVLDPSAAVLLPPSNSSSWPDPALTFAGL